MVTAEVIGYQLNLSLLARLASMGPRLVTAEVTDKAIAERTLKAASMGPRLVTAEVVLGALEGSMLVSASMGPRLVTAEVRPRGAPRSALKILLQWGRGWLPRKSIHPTL